MNFRSNRFLITVITSAILLIASCTFTTTKPKDPVFKQDIGLVKKDLDSMVTCERINLAGAEVKTNGKVATKIEISVINGKNIPVDNAGIKALGKSIAVTVKKALADPKAYQEYSVLFVTEENSGGINKRNWKGHSFKSEEL